MLANSIFSGYSAFIIITVVILLFVAIYMLITTYYNTEKKKIVDTLRVDLSNIKPEELNHIAKSKSIIKDTDNLLRTLIFHKGIKLDFTVEESHTESSVEGNTIKLVVSKKTKDKHYRLNTIRKSAIEQLTKLIMRSNPEKYTRSIVIVNELLSIAEEFDMYSYKMADNMNYPYGDFV